MRAEPGSASFDETVARRGHLPSQATTSEMIRFQQSSSSSGHKQGIDERLRHIEMPGCVRGLSAGSETVL